MISMDGYVCLTIYDMAQRYVGIREIPGQMDNPAILAMLKLTDDGKFDGWPEHDEVAWCSAAMNWWAWHLHLPRSKHLQARSWLNVGKIITLDEAQPKNDVVVLKRANDDSGPEVVDLSGPVPLYPPGHVGVYAGRGDRGEIMVLGGNQGNTVSIAPYAADRLLGVRRLLG